MDGRVAHTAAAASSVQDGPIVNICFPLDFSLADATFRRPIMMIFPRVAVVANARIPGERAQSIQTVRTAAAFARLGREVELYYAKRRVKRVIAGAQGDPLHYYGVRERVTLHAVPVIDFIESVPRSLQYLPAKIEEATFAWNAARRIIKLQKTLVHCREIEVGLLLAKRRHPAYLFEAHSIPGNRVRRGYLQKALAGALAIISITKGLADDLAEAFSIDRREIEVIPDGFDPAAFLNLPNRDGARAALGITTNKPLVVYAGHLFAWKGVDALALAAAKAPNLQFRFVGGLPEDVARMQASVKSFNLQNVEILGHRPPAEIPMHLASADIISIPNSGKQQISARHTSPLKLFEAMAAGRAVVASDLISLREILTNDQNAMLTKPDDPEALAAALISLAADTARRERLAARALADSVKYTFEARAARLLAVAESRFSRRNLS